MKPFGIVYLFYIISSIVIIVYTIINNSKNELSEMNSFLKSSIIFESDDNSDSKIKVGVKEDLFLVSFIS